MDIGDVLHALVDRDVNAMVARHGMVTLGEFATCLELVNPTLPVTFSDGKSPGIFHSYRGHYRFPAITRQDEPCSVGDLLGKVKAAIGATYDGWHGGEYTMTRHSPVWVSEMGDSSGMGIVSIEVQLECIVLVVERCEDEEA